jgi:curved DNA-binding protein CbpA
MDPFQILGLSADASINKVRRAFHRLSLQCHPDKAGESPTLLFHHVNAAHGLLKSRDFDPGKKSSTEAPRGSSDFDNHTTEDLFEDLLRDYMQARDA